MWVFRLSLRNRRRCKLQDCQMNLGIRVMSCRKPGRLQKLLKPSLMGPSWAIGQSESALRRTVLRSLCATCCPQSLMSCWNRCAGQAIRLPVLASLSTIWFLRADLKNCSLHAGVFWIWTRGASDCGDGRPRSTHRERHRGVCEQSGRT